MKKKFCSNNLRPARFATFASALLFALGVTLAFWAATTPVAQAVQPSATPITSPTPTPGKGHQECVVCHNVQHNPHTITIDCNALKAHLAHGDYQGPCQATPTPTPKKDCTVCHNGKDKSVPCDKVDDWLSHHPGDTRGSCVPTPVKNR